MRMTRLLAALLAIAVLALGSLSLTSPASAQVEERAKVKREVTFMPKNAPNNSFYIYGKVEKFQNKTFKLERRINKGPWKVVNKVRTKGSGKYQVRVYNTGGTPCFRAKVPGSNKFKPYTTPRSGWLCIS